MRKKIICCLLLLTMILSTVPVAEADASVRNTVTTDIEYFDDGTYFKTTVAVSAPEIQTMDLTQYQKVTKVGTFYNSDDEPLWEVCVIGYFKYISGNYSTCYDVDGYAKTYTKLWKVSDFKCSKSENTATASAKGTQYASFIPIGSKVQTVSVSLDKYGRVY